MFGKFTVNSNRDHISVKDFRPDDTAGLSKADIEEKYKKLHDEFEELQEKFYASKKYALLIVLQGMDCSGKDGTVRKALSGINPNGFYVENFKVPTPLELNHDYLWRVHQKTPKRGDIVVFNRSYYEDVLVTRVHRTIDDETAHRRFDEIREFEKYLVNNDTILLKFFLHISKDFQQKKLEERLETPEKNWKFSAADLKERRFWDEYQHCYSDVLSHCSTKEAPWYVVPANHRWFRDYFVLSVIVKTLKELSLEFPAIDGDVRELIKEVKNNK
ncbi:PPK2 family polyphosphate kinase [Faecalispora jeddahensis]|uniref:PPK2 family polyphosphate kinase n=1 Tax=Faecalispora jeddahensis TaxID=1414721 RepID=UPI00145B6FC5|nr:PPK2 family polyphosphate kinase [Faecalispora jeddahensis]